MRLLHICSEYPPQKIFGLGRYVAGLAQELAAQQNSVHVLTNSIGGVDPDAVERGVHLHRVDFPPPPMPPTPGAPVMAFNVHLQQKALSLGRQGLGDPEVVVSHDWLTAVAGHRIARRLDLPHVWTVHDTVHGKRFGTVDEVEDRLGFAIEKWASKSADLVLVNSVAIGDEIEKAYGADRKRVDLLHPGFDPGMFQNSSDAGRLEAFRSILAEPDELLITFAGRFDPEKGVDTLLNAFAALKARRPKVRLAIAGRGVLQETIQEHLRKLGFDAEVTHCGYLEGEVLRTFYEASDLHVCPSHYEPFGLVALEAMAVGAPVIVSDTGGLRDIISSAKVGRRSPPGDPQALCDILVELVDSERLRRQLGEAGRKHVLRNFSWSVLAPRAVKIYSHVAAGKEAVPA